MRIVDPLNERQLQRRNRDLHGRTLTEGEVPLAVHRHEQPRHAERLKMRSFTSFRKIIERVLSVCGQTGVMAMTAAVG